MLLLYATDMIFTARIRAEATAAGAAIGVARGVESLRKKLDPSAADAAAGSAASPRLVVVDLDADDAIAAVSASAAAKHRPRIVAYVSHVRADLAQAAREAGADEVLARSAFVVRLPRLAAESIA